MKDGYALDALETIFQIEINSWEMDIFLGGSISISGICGWQDGSRQLKESLSLILDDHSFFYVPLFPSFYDHPDSFPPIGVLIERNPGNTEKAVRMGQGFQINEHKLPLRVTQP